MTKQHYVGTLMLLAASSLAVTVLHARNHGKETDFAINLDRPFVYLEFDHAGTGIPRSEDESASRVWFRLTNNSRVPIAVRTFGVPEGSPKYEIGVMYEVVRNRPVRGAFHDYATGPTEYLR